MRWRVLLLATLAHLMPTGGSPVLVFEDEFEGPALDTDKWTYDEGDGCDYNLCQWGNSELQWYRKENVAVDSGDLVLSLKKGNYASRDYTSGKVISKRKAAFTYGRVEARIKAPKVALGLWPAFWLLPNMNKYGTWASSGEIDVFESNGNMTTVINNLAFNGSYPNQQWAADYDGGSCAFDTGAPLGDDYHVYAVDWSADSMKWYFDDQLICTKTTWFAVNSFTGEALAKPAPFDQDFYMILNLALGGSYGGSTIADDVDGAEMRVDYVRVYQDSDSAAPPGSVYLLDASGGGSTGGELVFSDEFDGGALDAAVWTAASGSMCEGDEALCTEEKQTYAAANAVVSSASGALELKVTGSESAGFVSGMVTTKGLFAFEHGRLEANVRLPTDSALTAALWLLPAASGASYGQIDVFAGRDVDSTANGTFAAIAASRTGSASEPTIFSCDVNGSALLAASDGGFRLWSVEWNSDRIRWYVDGLPVCENARSTVTNAVWPFSGEFYVGVGVTVGRDASGAAVSADVLAAAAADADAATLAVDYVRVYQLRDELPVEESAYLTDGYKIWWQEFNDGWLDETWWNVITGDGTDTAAGQGNGNREAQYYTNENHYVADGNLVMTAKHQPYGEKEQEKGSIFTSTKLTTQGKADFLRGRFEARIKLPKGQGLWPAFWLMPTDSEYGNWSASGEIDIMENRDYMEKSLGQLHFGRTYPKTDNLLLYEGGLCYRDDVDDYSADFHVYALEWEVDKMRWFIDGRMFCERSYWYAADDDGKKYDFPAPFDKHFYPVLTLAVGGVFTGGPIDVDALPQSMYVDYIRIYSMDESDIIMTESSGSGSTAIILVAVACSFAGAAVLLCAAAALSKRRRRRAMAAAAAAAGGSELGGPVHLNRDGRPIKGAILHKDVVLSPIVSGAGGGGSAAVTPVTPGAIGVPARA